MKKPKLETGKENLFLFFYDTVCRFRIHDNTLLTYGNRSKRYRKVSGYIATEKQYVVVMNNA